MDVNALRTWGMTVSAAAMAGALTIALMGGEPPRVRADVGPETADAASAISFLVRLQGQGPIAQAARAGDARAERVIAEQLQRQSDLNGLCFGGFAGSAEIILRSCDAIAVSARESAAQVWLQRLRAMRAVAYAEIDTTAPPARAPD